MDMRKVIENAIQDAMRPVVVAGQTGPLRSKFDPLIGGLISSFLLGLVQACIEKRLKRQHEALQHKEEGSRLERKMRTNMTVAFRKQHPEIAEADVMEHVSGSLVAFKSMSREELDKFIDEAQKPNAEALNMIELADDLS